MTNLRQEMKAALECRQPAEVVPIWELHFHCWDQASGKHIFVGREFEALTAAEQEKAVAANAEVMLSVAENLHFAAVTIPDSFWETAPGVPSYYWLPDEARLKLASKLHQMAGSDLMVVAANGAILGQPGPGEYVEFCYKLFDAPEEIDEKVRARFVAGIEDARKMRDVGVGALYAAADLADNRGPFFNPEQMDRFVLPYLEKWATTVKDMGLYAMLHTDGNIGPLLEDLVDTGVHALQAIAPVAGMDIRQVKTAVGDRVCLCGNVDCGLLFFGPGEKIYETTRDLLRDCKPGGGFVLGASNAIQRETPIAHYCEMIRAWRDYGRY